MLLARKTSQLVIYQLAWSLKELSQLEIMILFYLDCGAIILGAVTLEVLVCIIFMPRISLHPTAN